MLTPTAAIVAAVLAASPAKTDPAAKSLGNASEKFSVDLLKVLQQKKENTFFSPYSIQTAMWMAGCGGKGVTQDEIRKGLHLGNDANASFTAVGQLLTQAAKEKKPDWADESWKAPAIRSANRLWHSDGFKIHAPYRTMLDDDFDAATEKLNFQNPAKAARTINAWVSDVTEKRIPNLVSPEAIPPQGLILTNAVYFKGGWAHKFSPSKSVKFTTSDGRAITPPGISDTGNYEYQDLPSAQVVRLHYQGDASMTIILPEQGKFDAVLQKLDFSKIKPAQVGRQVVVTMPKFKTGQHSSIASALQQLGITAAFDPSRADFTSITDSKPAYISDVIHAANIDVDENGTEAAAATAVMMTVGAPAGAPPRPVYFTVDRPFIFYISNTSSGTVLFAGIINDPTAK